MSKDQFYSVAIQGQCPKYILDMLKLFAEVADQKGIGYRKAGFGLSDALYDVEGSAFGYENNPISIAAEPTQRMSEARLSEAFKVALEHRPGLRAVTPEDVQRIEHLTRVVLGEDLDAPLNHLIVWCKDGRELMMGGSLQPIELIRQIATWNSVTVTNLYLFRGANVLKSQIEMLREK